MNIKLARIRSSRWCDPVVIALVLCLAAAAHAQVLPASPVTSPVLQPIQWQQRTLFIPYQVNRQLPASQEIAQVQLLMSRTGTGDWVVLQSAEPNVQGFNYHAPEDGPYWFAVKHFNAENQPLDGAVVVPQLHLVIDTQVSLENKPAFDVATTEQPVADGLGPRAPAQPNSETSGRSPFASGNPFQSAAAPIQDWPVNNQLPVSSQATTPATGAPPIINPYTTAGDNLGRRTPARFAVDDSKGGETVDSDDVSADALDGQSESSGQSVGPPPSADSDWNSAGHQGGPLLVNARTFDVEYDLQAVGSWGVAKVELWGTQDAGATWQSFGIDSDNRSPIRVTVPNSGMFGFRILVEGANSIGATPPQAGDKPELVVVVDLEQPKVEITAVESGAGNFADQLRIRWLAEDTNFEPRPIGLFYSSFPNGPWSTIAAGLENTGSYIWRIERHVPGRFFLRLEARDTAGNVATFETPQPFELNRPQPTGTLRGVRPVSDVPAVGR